MTPAHLKASGIRLYGRKKWKTNLAEALAVNVSTIHRLMHRPEIPGPYEVAIKGLIENKKAIDAAAATARKLGLVPRRKRKKVLTPGGKPRRKKEKRVEKVRDRDVRSGDVAVVDPIASD